MRHHLAISWLSTLSMAKKRLKSPLFTLLISLLLGSAFLSACDTGFGEPCTLPEGDAIEQACSSPTVEQGEENGTTQSASATCALDNFPGCSTFLCLKYRGANPYCSLKCAADSECDGGKCCPLVGDCQNTASNANMSVDPNTMMSAVGNDCVNGDCYCIRQGDLGR